jgi:hypothetical protein
MAAPVDDHAPAFSRVIRAIEDAQTDAKRPSRKHNPLSQPALTSALAATPGDHWLAFVLRVALNRRKFGTAETPDALVFTATQLYNYLNGAESKFGAPCPYQDAVFLALVLSGEASMKHVRESIHHFHSRLVYCENGEDSDEDDDSDDEYEESSDDDGGPPSSEEEAVETDDDDEYVERNNKRHKKAAPEPQSEPPAAE